MTRFFFLEVGKWIGNVCYIGVLGCFYSVIAETSRLNATLNLTLKRLQLDCLLI